MKQWLSRMGISLLFAALFAPVAMAANAFDVYSVRPVAAAVRGSTTCARRATPSPCIRISRWRR